MAAMGQVPGPMTEAIQDGIFSAACCRVKGGAELATGLCVNVNNTDPSPGKPESQAAHLQLQATGLPHKHIHFLCEL